MARRGAIDRASEYLQQLHDCLDGVPDAERPAALTEAARLHLLLGDSERAAELCRKACEQMAQSGGATKLTSLAEPIARAGQMDLALQCVTATSESARTWVQAAIAGALAESGAYDDAVDLAQATVASEEAPNFTQGHRNQPTKRHRHATCSEVSQPLSVTVISVWS